MCFSEDEVNSVVPSADLMKWGLSAMVISVFEVKYIPLQTLKKRWNLGRVTADRVIVFDGNASLWVFGNG
jgi:hypothetical protein